MAGLWAGSAAGQPSAGPPAGATVRSLRDFWALAPDERSRPQAFRLECDINHYDPEWRGLWIQDGLAGAYVPVGDRALPVQAGQRYIVEGITPPPNNDLSFDGATFTPIGPAARHPLDTAGRIDHSVELSALLVSANGLVDQQRLPDPSHLQLRLSAEGQPLSVWIRIRPGERVPDFVGANVRITGVYNAKLTTAGQISTLELLVSSLAAVEVVSRLDNDPRFEIPPHAIEDLARAAPDRLVRIAGLVKAQESGRSVRIRDDTGQIDLITAQTQPLQINQRIEAIGYPSIHGTDWRLRDAVYRQAAPAEPATGALHPTLPKLRLAAQVLELPAEEATQGYPVRISGVVTWSHPNSPFLFVQDASGGVCVVRGSDPSKLRPPGRHVEVSGKTGIGDFAPVVIASAIAKLGDQVLPEARAVSLEHALTGAEEGQWVEMRGFLRQVRTDGDWTRLELATSAGDFSATLPATDEMVGRAGAVVRIKGVCAALANPRRQLTGINLWVPSPSFIQVEEPPPAHVFDVSSRSIASLSQFGTLQSFNRRVKVTGEVLLHSPGHYLYLQEGGEALLVLSRSTTPLSPGDRAEAVGFIGRQGSRVVLRECEVRRIGTISKSPARPLARPSVLESGLDAHLVQVEALLIDRGILARHVRLTLQADNTVFEAQFDLAPTMARPDWPVGSRLALTGVYELKFDEHGMPLSFVIRLRSHDDVQVLATPSWWTQRRILSVTGALALGIVAVFGWVFALRRRVARQTEQIREQIQREAHLQAELQRASRLESLGILAGGIAHDFNNLLTVVMGNLSLARLDAKVEAETTVCLDEAEKAVDRARGLTQQLLTFAKGGSPIRTSVALPDVVREVTQFVLHGSKVKCEYDIPPALPPASVDKGQFGRVVQNIVLNAVQAMPGGGAIRLTLRDEKIEASAHSPLPAGHYLRLSIADSGVGIAPADLPKIFDPYFTTKRDGSGLGLAAVYSIVKKHAGHVSVESAPGQGTTFHIWVPAAEAEPEAGEAGGGDLPRLAGRVLFMDDEEPIRRLGAAMLRRLGLEPTTVPDGAAAVEAFRTARELGQPFDLVILDLTVPGGMGGRQAIEQIQSVDPAAKAIVSSGYSNDRVLAEYRQHGFAGMVSKPYELSDLAQTINAVLNGGPA